MWFVTFLLIAFFALLGGSIALIVLHVKTRADHSAPTRHGRQAPRRGDSGHAHLGELPPDE